MKHLSKKAGKFAILTVCVLAVTLLVYLLPFRAIYPDVSGNHVFSLSSSSKQYLKTVSDDVELIYHAVGGKANIDRDIYAFLLTLAEQNAHIRVTVQHAETDDTVEVRSAKRSRIFSIYDLFYQKNSLLGISFSVPEYAQLMQEIYAETDASYRSQMISYYASGNTLTCFSADANLTNAVRYVLSDAPPSLLLCGKNTEGVSFFLKQELEQAGYTTESTTALTMIPEQIDTVILNVMSDLTEAECQTLSAYLERGGSLILTTSCTASDFPRLSEILAAYGLSAPTETSILYDASQGISFSAVMGDHPSVDLLENAFVSYYAHPIHLTETEGVQHTVLFRSSANTYAFNALDNSASTEGLTPDSYVFGAVATKGDSKIAWISQPFDTVSEMVSSGANFDFAKSLLDWMNDYGGKALEISGKSIPTDYFAPTDTVFVIWTVVFVLIIPLSLLLIGFFRKQIRRKQ